MTRIPALALALMPTVASAACPELTVLSCMIGAKRLEVCATGDSLTYAFGRDGRPADLVLTEPLAAGTYTPWNGIGRSIWESVDFRNDGHVYTVWSSFDRMDPGARVDHGVTVQKGDATLATLTCAPGAVAAPFDALFDRMEARGFCWSREDFRWNAACG